jgi:putative spermidine/putrescine transport system permease protein
MAEFSANTESATERLTTADGVPLQISLARAQRRQKLQALALVAPLFLFILVTFFLPIADMLFRSVQNDIVPDTLPRTVQALAQWNPEKNELPDESVFAAMAADLREARRNRTNSKVGQRLNYEQSGLSSLFRKTPRRLRRVKEGPYKDVLLKIDSDWGDPETWKLIKRFSGYYTAGYFLAAADLDRDSQGNIVAKPEDSRIYWLLFQRTLLLSLVITLMTLLLGYPIAYLLATLPARISNLLIILVLLPFWTSLLVRTTSWIVLLQQQGVINDFLVATGLIGEDGRLSMIYNATGTVVAMTHILLPFMILPIYSVMKNIPPSYVRAARSLGATSFTAFWRVYFPNTIPGIGAGAILVFILAIGYYITPELVGGTSGTFISNRIAHHISASLNWGLAAALGTILLVIVLALYFLYDRIVGIDNMKLG